MATIVTETTICDRQHRKETEAVTTVRFTWDGQDREADLCAACSSEYASAVGPFADCGRKAVPASVRKPQPRDSRTPAGRAKGKLRREWLVENGWAVAAKGKLPNDAAAAADVALGFSR